jgi:PilZ domain-containing protein
MADSNRRKFPRKAFNFDARIVDSDGSWEHECHIVDVSATGARLTLKEPVKVPTEFLLALTKQGKAVRKCHLVWNNGNEIGISFDAIHDGKVRAELEPKAPVPAPAGR